MPSTENLDKRVSNLENLHIYGAIILGLGIIGYLIFKQKEK